MTIGSLFSGFGGLELGLEWAGLGPVLYQVESDAFCRAVLAKHWPHAKRFEDVCTVQQSDLPRVRVMCGGFPCQDLSVSGKRPASPLEASRSGLWRHFARIVAFARPLVVVVENVPRLVAQGLDRVVGDLERIGYDVAGSLIAARDCGAPHRRQRLFLVAYASRKRREGVASSDSANGHLGEQRGNDPARRRDDVADPDRIELRHAKQRQPARSEDGVCDEGRAEPGNNRGSGGGSAKCVMGRGADGVPDRVERWPSGPGEEQAEWEPPRVLVAPTRRERFELDPNRRRRLKGLGNAASPIVAYGVGLRVRELLERIEA